jgi:hypothetical protein
MPRIAIFFTVIFLSFGQAFAATLSDSVLLEKIAKKYYEQKNDIVLIEFSVKEVSFTYYDSDKEQVEKKSVDLGIDRINAYIIREVKRKNPKVVKSPNPMSLSDLMFASQFINTQLSNMIPNKIHWRLYSKQLRMVYIDERFSGELKEMICFPYSNSLDADKLVNVLTENLGKNDKALEKAGFSEPRFDLMRLLLGYNFFKSFGYYTSFVEGPSIKEQIDE